MSEFRRLFRLIQSIYSYVLSKFSTKKIFNFVGSSRRVDEGFIRLTH